MALLGWLVIPAKSPAPYDKDSLLWQKASPDGRRRAIAFHEAGGGGVSPYCFEYVSVVELDRTDAEAFKADFRIYEGSCGGLRGTKQDFKVEWLSNTRLLVGFDPTVAARDISKVSLRGHDHTGAVKIEYSQP